MSYNLESFVSPIDQIPYRPYLPHLVAVESGVLENPEELAKPLNTSAGEILANGKIPNVQQAGIVDINDRLYAFDHVSLSIESSNLMRIGPSPKSAIDVSRGGRFQERGVVSMLDLERYTIRIVGVAIDRLLRPLSAQHLGRHSLIYRPGVIDFVNFSHLDTAENEVTDIDLDTQSVLVKQRTKYF